MRGQNRRSSWRSVSQIFLNIGTTILPRPGPCLTMHYADRLILEAPVRRMWRFLRKVCFPSSNHDAMFI